MSLDSAPLNLTALLRQSDSRETRGISECFSERLITLIRQYLDRCLRGKVYPEYILQPVFLSFFYIQQEHRIRFSQWDILWLLKIVLALRKCDSSYHRSACHDALHREGASLACGVECGRRADDSRTRTIRTRERECTVKNGSEQPERKTATPSFEGLARA